MKVAHRLEKHLKKKKKSFLSSRRMCEVYHSLQRADCFVLCADLKMLLTSDKLNIVLKRVFNK